MAGYYEEVGIHERKILGGKLNTFSTIKKVKFK